MIYILSEDSANGFQFCNVIKKLYFDNKFNDIVLDTLGGIPNLAKKLTELADKLMNEDKIIIVYDDVRENPLVDESIDISTGIIEEKGIYDKVIWLSTYAFELELMLIIGFEFFTNIDNYTKYFRKLRDTFYKTHEIRELTKLSKSKAMYPLYLKMYEKAKEEKLKPGGYSYYQRLSAEKFEQAMTIETISKAIMKEVFKRAEPEKASDYVDKPMGKKDPNNCWKNNCCHKSRRCKNSCIDFDAIIEKQKTEEFYKTKFLILNSSYRKLITFVYKLEGQEIELPEIVIADLVHKETLNALECKLKYNI